MASVTRKIRTSAPSASEISATRRSGLGRLEIGGELQRRLGGTGVADGRGVVDRRRAGEFLREPVVGTGMGPGDQDVVDRLLRLGAVETRGRFHARGRERADPGRHAELEVLGLAEALFPALGASIAGRAPAVEELTGDRGAAEVLGDDRPADSSPTRSRRRRRRLADSSGEFAGPVRMSAAVTRTADSDDRRAAQRTDPGPDR